MTVAINRNGLRSNLAALLITLCWRLSPTHDRLGSFFCQGNHVVGDGSEFRVDNGETQSIYYSFFLSHKVGFV